MKNYCLIFAVLFLSACSVLGEKADDFVDEREIKVEKIQRFEAVKIQRQALENVKLKAETIEERQRTHIGYDHLNIYERYGIEFSRDEKMFLEEFGDLKKRDYADYDFAPSLRISHFLDEEVGENYGDFRNPYQKSIMGVSYNSREGYLKTAKLDTNYPKGYIESMEDARKRESVGVIGSQTGNFEQSGASGVGGASGQGFSSGSSSQKTGSSSNKHVSLDSSDSPKGYLEAYYEKYGRYPSRNEGYAGGASGGSSSGAVVNPVDIKDLEPVGYLSNANSIDLKRPSGYLEVYGDESHPKGFIEATGGSGDYPKGFIESNGGDFERPNGFIEASGGNFEHPKGFIEATGGVDNRPSGFLGADGNENLRPSYGFIENSGGDVYRPSGYLDGVSELHESPKGYIENVCVVEEGELVCPERGASYIGNSGKAFSPKGYLENTKGWSAPKGYIETYSVYYNRPFLGYYGF
jgi:hypothetical protein